MKRLEQWGWLAVAFVLCALAIPWFLWGDATVVAGLPLWLWWHVGWMVLASAVFWAFARRAWGVGIEPDEARGASSDRTPSSRDPGGERR